MEPVLVSELSELHPLLDDGVEVLFLAAPIVFRLNGSAMPGNKIRVQADPGCFERLCVAKRDILFDQKVSVWHEFHHLENIRQRREHFRSPHNPEYEELLDAHARTLIATKPLMLEELIFELIVRDNCTIDFSMRRTPFFRFYRKVVRKRCRTLPFAPQPIGEADLKILRHARARKLL